MWRKVNFNKLNQTGPSLPHANSSPINYSPSQALECGSQPWRPPPLPPSPRRWCLWSSMPATATASSLRSAATSPPPHARSTASSSSRSVPLPLPLPLGTPLFISLLGFTDLIDGRAYLLLECFRFFVVWRAGRRRRGTVPITLSSSGTRAEPKCLFCRYFLDVHVETQIGLCCRQESYFAYLFGVREPGFYGAIVSSLPFV
jgi:hypothetical protein